MAFVNPEVLRKIFAREEGAPQGQELWQMLAGAGAGMTRAAGQPGAGFAQALGGGAQGMLQGQQAAQQYQMNQLQMQRAQAEMARDAERQERLRKILGGGTTFASQIDARPAATPQLGGGNAQASPYTGGPGAMTARYESGNNPAAVSTGQGDPGGQSYGRFQLSSDAGTMSNFLQSPEGQPFAQHFSGQEPGTPQFNQSFQEVVQGAGPEFERAQQQYLQRTHVQPVMAAASRAGMPVDNPAIQAALHSQATQHSGDGNIQIINETMARIGPNSGPEEILDTLYDVRQQYATRALQSSGASEDVIQGVQNRYRQERQETLGMLGERQVGGTLGGQAQPAAQPQMNGYQMREAQQQANSPFANLPAETRQILAMMEPEDAFKAMIDMQQGGDTPARIQEAQMIAAETGEPVGTVLARMRKIMPGGEDELTTANRTREQRIAAMIENDPSADPQAIRDAVYGRRVVSHDPVSRRAQVVDIVTGEVIEGASVEETERAQAAVADEELMSTIVPEGMDVSPGTGASGFWANIANTTLGAVGLGPIAPEAEVAIQAMNNLKTQTMVALAEEVAGRPSNYLLEQFERIAPSPANLLQGDARAHEKLRATSALIDDKLRMVNDVVNNPGKYSPTTVDAARQNKLKLEALKRQYDSAYENFGTRSRNRPQSGVAPGVSEFTNEQGNVPPAPEGVPADAWEFMTDEQRALWQN